ncbi:MAG: GNAT family N-acetyltransferase [Bacilli bacterium]
MDAITKLMKTELAYTAQFAEMDLTDTHITFTDTQLLTMYMHNYSYVREQMPYEELLEWLYALGMNRKKDNHSFTNVVFAPAFTNVVEQDLMSVGCVSRFGVYAYNNVNGTLAHADKRLKFSFAKTKHDLEAIRALDCAQDESDLGASFCNARAERRGRVYVSPESSIRALLAWCEGELVGYCELFAHEETTKIENVSVHPNWQKRGYGTQIVQEAVRQSAESKQTYVVVDEEDTTARFYARLGFGKCGTYVSLLLLH